MFGFSNDTSNLIISHHACNRSHIVPPLLLTSQDLP